MAKERKNIKTFIETFQSFAAEKLTATKVSTVVESGGPSFILKIWCQEVIPRLFHWFNLFLYNL